MVGEKTAKRSVYNLKASSMRIERLARSYIVDVFGRNSQLTIDSTEINIPLGQEIGKLSSPN